MKKLKIAFDGPAACGKSTISKEVAKKLSYLYIDTGAMYRAVTWIVLTQGIDVNDEEAVTKLAEIYSIDLVPFDNRQGYKVFIDNKDITEDIVSPDVNKYVSPVAKISSVRRILVKRQQEIAKDGGVVMAGRDITTVVLPDADLKIYLDASIEERTKRRVMEFRSQGKDADEKETAENLKMRDKIDSGREDSPLMIAKDAIVLDTTGKNIEQVVNEVMELAESKKL